MTSKRPKSKAANRAILSVIDDAMAKTEPGEAVVFPMLALLRAAQHRMAETLVTREDGERRGALAAVKSREQGRALAREEWDEINRTLHGRSRSVRARTIMSRVRADMAPGAIWPTERVIYDYLSLKENRK